MSSSNQSSAPARKSRGRQRISMVKMENQSNLQVTFSKRRAGLFKKASELSTLCGAETAIVVFSPANKAFCFGHPNVQTVVERLEARAPPAPANPRSQLIMEAHRNSTIRELNVELTRVESALKAEKMRSQMIDAVRKAGRVQKWMPPSLEGFDYEELGALKECIMGFQKDLDAKVEKDRVQPLNPVPFPQPTPENGQNPTAFPLGVVPNVPFGSSDSDGGLGFTNPGFSAPNTSLGEASNSSMIDDFIMNGGDPYNLRALLSFGDGTNSSSSSENPANSNTIGDGGFGFNPGYNPGLY